MTLDISKVIYNELKRLGISVYMTRTNDETLSPSERTKRVLNTFGKDDDVVVISNHINAGGCGLLNYITAKIIDTHNLYDIIMVVVLSAN